jgi:NAD-dependent deacetylase
MRPGHTFAPFMQNLLFFTGAGISAESGLRTFRAEDGLWEDHNIYEVATPEAFARDPALVLRFYDERRAQVRAARPNAAHLGIAQLQGRYSVQVVTQNIDDLHERAGTKEVLHLHGEVCFARSTANPSLLIPWHGPLGLGDRCPLGSQLRPHVVWFGEEVPAMPKAMELAAECDRLVVVGTSLQVYPAANLLLGVRPGVPIDLIDPAAPAGEYPRVRHMPYTATKGLALLAAELLQ